MKQILAHLSSSHRRAVSLGGLVLGLLAAASVLQGCASAAAPGSTDIRTESDRSDADRRAAVRIELAGGYFSRGQYSTALDEIKLALSLKPEMREAINMRNLVYAAMGETALAEEGFKRAIATGPHDGDSLHNYAWYLCQQERWGQSFALFDQALAEPSYRSPSRTQLARGVCEARSGALDKAERSLSKAFELEPGNPAISLNLAEVLLRLNQLERARFYARRVNAQAEYVNAQSLWVELRIERKLGNSANVEELGQQLRRKFADASEAQKFRDGRFEE